MNGQSLSTVLSICGLSYERVIKQRTIRKLTPTDVQQTSSNSNKNALKDSNSANLSVTSKISEKEKVASKKRQQYNEVSLNEYTKCLNAKRDEYLSFVNNAEMIREVFCGRDNLRLTDIRNVLHYGANFLNLAKDMILFLFYDDNIKQSFKVDDKIIDKIVKPLLNPTPTVIFSDFGLTSHTGLTIHPRMRYLPNVDLQGIKRHIENIISKTTVNERKDDVRYKILQGISLMFIKLSNQHRFGSFESHILSCYLMKQKLCEKEYYTNLPDDIPKSDEHKTGIDTVCWQFLRKIILHYDGVPFYIKKQDNFSKNNNLAFNDSIILRTDKKISCCLPGIIHALLNGVINEILGDLTHETALLYVKHVFFCGDTSIYQTQLDYKSKMRSWVKLLHDRCGYVLTTRYSEDMRPLRQDVCWIEEEIWIDDKEKPSLISKLKHLPSYYLEFVNKQLNYIEKRRSYVKHKIDQFNMNYHDCDIDALSIKDERKIEASKTTEYLRWIIMSTTIISNFSLYNKTSLLLEYEKSVGTRMIKMLPCASSDIDLISSEGFKIPLKKNWHNNEVLNSLSKIFDDEWSECILSDFNSIKDFEKRFVTFLTNRSGGIKSDEPTLSKELKGISNARIIAFCIDRDKYDVESEFMSMLLASGKCAIRFQIDRRARIIVIVPNAIQTNELFLLLAFNCLKSNPTTGKKMAVGKQVGNMLDARVQLIHSGDVSTIKNSGDMSGMDAHTLPEITTFLRYKVLEVMMQMSKGYDERNDHYFFSNDKEYDVLISENGLNVIESRFLKGIVIHSAKVLHNMYTMNMFLEDGFFGKGMFVSDQTFQSGFFGTSAQHTLFLDLIITLSMKMFYDKIKNSKFVSLIHWIMGDDIFEVIVNGFSHQDVVKKWLKVRNDNLKYMNYEEEIDLSRMYGVFLQQAALLGIYVPFPARVSVFCDERSEIIKRHPIDVIRIVLDVLSVRAHRSYAIDNCINIGYSIWNAHRSMRYSVSSNDTDLIRKIHDSSDINLHKQFLTKEFNSYRCVYPFVLICVSPVSWPLLSFCLPVYGDELLIFNAKSVTTPSGDVNTILINEMFYKYKELHMFDVKRILTLVSEKIKVSIKADFLHWENRHEWGFTLSEHLLRFKRLRRLTETRKEDLGVGEIEIMVSNLNKYLDPTMLHNSFIAADSLRGKRLNVPDGLLYVNHNRTKIEQALTVKCESLEERTVLDRHFLRHILDYNIKPKSDEVIKQHLLCSIRMRINEDMNDAIAKKDTIIPSLDSVFNFMLPFLPGYHLNSAYSKLLPYTSLPELLDRNISGIIGEITGSLGASFDIEAAVEYGAYVYTHDPNLIVDAAIAIGIPTTMVSKFENLVIHYLENNFNVKYHSIFNSSRFFGISGNLSKFKNASTYSGQLLRVEGIKGLDKFQEVFARDLIFANVLDLNLRRIYIEYSVHSLLVIISRGSMKFFRRHLNKLFNDFLKVDYDDGHE